jgi:type II secretory pathway pseudopilin PulG
MRRLAILIALATAALLQPSQASAQTWSPQQQEVWVSVQARWAALASGPDSKVCVLHPDFRAWTASEPFPFDGESATQWTRYDMESVSTVVRNLVPMTIAVAGDTAVVHYYFYAPSRADREGQHRSVRGRYTDTLVKESNRWRFLAWSGGPPAGQ